MAQVPDVYEDTLRNTYWYDVEQNPQKRVAYSIYLGDLNADDVVIVAGQVEMTERHTVNQGLGVYVVVGDSASDTTGTQIVRASVMNVTNNMHHQVRNPSTIWKVPSNMTGVYLNMVVYGLSTTLNSWGDIEQLGYLRAAVFRAE